MTIIKTMYNISNRCPIHVPHTLITIADITQNCFSTLDSNCFYEVKSNIPFISQRKNNICCYSIDETTTTFTFVGDK